MKNNKHTIGKIRLFEITGGDASWDQHQVTLKSLLQGKSMSDVVNGQMVYDAEISGIPGSLVLFTISQPVLQRLINGTTKGLLICPLGAVDASFYDSENQSDQGPVLHFNVKPIKQTEVP